MVRGHEAAPIIANNTMYIITPYPNIVYAIDLTQTGGPVKWKYESNPASSSQGVACCDVVNRGGVYYEGKIFFNTLDISHAAAQRRDEICLEPGRRCAFAPPREQCFY